MFSACLLALLLSACHGSGADISSQLEDVRADSMLSVELYPEDPPEGNALPLAGSRSLPPQAYADDHIVVFFRNDLTAAELATAGIGIELPIPVRRNPQLRNDQACELLAEVIGRELAIDTGSQVYSGRTRMVEYRLAPGQAPDSVLAEMTMKYGDFIMDAAASQLVLPAFAPDDPDFSNSGKSGGPQWYLHAMDFDDAWEHTLGDNSVLLAVLDSGCNLQHEELSGQVIDPASEFPEIEADIANGNASIEDSYGHGTAVCGILAAATDNGRTLAGAAPGCGVVPIKTTNDWLDFTIGRYIEGGYLAQQIEADILVQSFTIWEANPAVHNMLLDLRDSGMLLLGAAGNDGDADDNWPAAWPEVISVGSTEIGDTRSSFSNFASSVELAAPGRDIRICGHQFNSGALAYLTEQGTSLSTPLVAAAAALLWSEQPGLDAPRVRELLALTGRPATGFPHSVPVVDAGALLDLQPGLNLPTLPGMIATGDLAFSAGVLLEPHSASLLLDGMELQTLGNAPWDFSVPTAGKLFSAALLSLRSEFAGEQNLSETQILIDNTSGVYPLQDDAELPGGQLAYFDAGQAQQQVRLSIENQFLPDWTEQSVKQFGQGRWQRSDLDAATGEYCWYCGDLATQEYDRDDFDCLVTARIDLSSASLPVLRFTQRFNVQDDGFGYDRLSVLASADNGASWELLTGEGHPGWFSGYQSSWETVEIPLDSFTGESLHICFSLQSDSLLAGEQAGQPEGWWLDDIYVGEAGGGQAEFNLLSPDASTVYGRVNGQQSIAILLSDISNVASMHYQLDCRPFGRNDGEDIVVNSTSPAGINLILNSIERPNQTAWLSLAAYDSLGLAGRSRLLPVLIFNLPGDVNADGLVDAADEQLLRQHMLLDADDPGWQPFLDADLDGRVTELDLAAIAYHWTAGN